MPALHQLSSQLARSFTRRLIWIESSQPESEAHLSKLLSLLGYAEEESCLISERYLCGLEPIRRGEFVRHLGLTYRCVVVDAFSGLNPGVLAQAAGTVCGGGVLILLTPDAEHWADYPDPEYVHLGAGSEPKGLFISWLISHLIASPAVIRSCKGLETLGFEADHQPQYIGVYLGEAQRTVVQRLLVQWRKPTSCIQIDADRGRGKSSALGLALALQTSFDRQNVIITAADKRALRTLTEVYARLCPESGPPVYRTPAQLLQQTSAPQCLIIDEAAALPLPILQRLCESAPHLVLASTQHGYEGFSRGYGLKFLRELSDRRSDFLRLELQQPLRWAEGDPLEAWVKAALLVDTEDVSASFPEGLNEIERQQLIEHPSWLNAIYQLLAQAHYRTSPSDLRLMLDSTGQRIFTYAQGGVLFAVAWVAEEGAIDSELAIEIAQGRRRPSGNLLPQSLIHYLGWPEAADQLYWRIVRIAVVEEHREQGVGRALLRCVESAAGAAGADFVGASFAAQAHILRFWEHAGYQLVRLGEGVDPVAAAPAAQVLLPMNYRAKYWQDIYIKTFNNNILKLLCDAEYKNMIKQWSTRSIQNFAHHFAPLSLVRYPLLQRFSEADHPYLSVLKQGVETLTPTQVKALRLWVAERLSDTSIK